MKAFHCDHCGNLLFFENFTCLRCQHPLGFIPELIDLCALQSTPDQLWQPLVTSAGTQLFRQCRNASEFSLCNWLVPSNDPDHLCSACRLNLVIPDLAIENNLIHWQKLEASKRRVLYSLLRLNLPFEAGDSKPPLRFKFLAELPGAAPVLTGHHEGVVTINIAEGDDAERERRRVALGEPFRTLLGHLRHEVAHYYWDRLIANSVHLAPFRELFGDEQMDYGQCLQSYYRFGPPPDWQTHFVSAYASAHPWEDWAETWAHYLHITDTLETAASFGLSLQPRHPQAATMRAELKKLSYFSSEFEEIFQNWIPLTHVLNEFNRGMGLQDLYPFVLTDTACNKLRFIHDLLRSINARTH